MSENSETEAPGWDAIDAAFARLYPGRKPFHVACVPPPGLGGDSVLNGVSVYEDEGGEPHWHYVTYGLTELFGKEADDPHESGFGFELTFRLKRAGEPEPPRWPFEMLHNLGRYVFATGRVFEAGQYRQRLAPLVQDVGTRLFSLIFVSDPELPPADTPNGRLRFVQAVGVTNDEMDAVWNVGVELLADLLARRSPKLVTDIARDSVLSQPEALRAIREKADRDGSPTEAIYVDRAEIAGRGPPTTLVLSATSVSSLLAVLPHRWRFGRDFTICCGDCVVIWARGERTAVDAGRHTRIVLDEEGFRQLVATLRPIAGRYAPPGLPELVIEVEPTEIRDAQGRVVDQIGAAM